MPRPGIGIGSRVTVIGLGYFGRAVAERCTDLGYEVLAIDLDGKLVAEVADRVALAIEGDGTDEDLLRGLQVERSDVGIVAQGSNREASILTTMLLKKIRVPYVVSKASSELHGEVLRAVGADRVVFPEHDEGHELAHALAVPSIQEYITLTPTSGVAKVEIPRSMVGRALSELLENRAAQISVLLIRRGNQMIATPSFSERLEAGDDLILAGPDVEIERFMEGAGQGEPR